MYDNLAIETLFRQAVLQEDAFVFSNVSSTYQLKVIEVLPHNSCACIVLIPVARPGKQKVLRLCVRLVVGI